MLTKEENNLNLETSQNTIKKLKSELCEIEVLPQSSLVRKPIIYKQGKAINKYLSISHGEHISVACLADNEYAIDVEKIKEHSTAFYKGNFTTYEKEIKKVYQKRYGINDSLYFSFLWTIKECVIKLKSELICPLVCWVYFLQLSNRF